MKVDSLDELKSAFAGWRKRKKHPREAMPEELLTRAQRATEKHGVTAVVGVTRVERSPLFRGGPQRKKAQAATTKKAEVAPSSAPAFSRFELGMPSTSGPRPIAELETVAGVKLRVFEETPELMGLLSAVCGFGGVR